MRYGLWCLYAESFSVKKLKGVLLMKKLLMLVLVLTLAVSAFAQLQVTGQAEWSGTNDLNGNAVSTVDEAWITFEVDVEINRVTATLDMSDMANPAVDEFFVRTDIGDWLGIDGIGLVTRIGKFVTEPQSYDWVYGWDAETVSWDWAWGGSDLAAEATLTIADMLNIVYVQSVFDNSVKDMMVGAYGTFGPLSVEAYYMDNSADEPLKSLTASAAFDLAGIVPGFNSLNLVGGFAVNLDDTEDYAWGAGLTGEMFDEYLFWTAAVGTTMPGTGNMAAGFSVEYFLPNDKYEVGAAVLLGPEEDTMLLNAEVWAGVYFGAMELRVGYSYIPEDAVALIEKGEAADTYSWWYWSGGANKVGGLFFRASIAF
jgi:hypothetical protein